MDPVEIKVSVVPADEIAHLRTRLTYLQGHYERLDRELEGLHGLYSEILAQLVQIKKLLKSK